MAFYQPGQATGDPNYLRQSREPDKQKPLEQVSIPANTITDTSMGELFKGIGTVAGDAANLLDSTIKRNIKSDAYAAIDPIRDEAGADLTPDEAGVIAGTGAKGRARALEMQGGGSLFGPAVPATEGDVALPGTQKELPADAQAQIERVQRMNEAKAAGKLSDSYYNAQLTAVAKELRARYPGYREEVDAAVSGITGITPANALRRSLLADMNANAAAAIASASEQKKWEEKNAPYIVQDRPDYFQNPQKYRGQENQIRSDVYQRQGREVYIKSQEAEIGFDSNLAKSSATARADLIASQALTSLTNASGLGNGQSIQQQVSAFAKNGAKPEELAQFTAQLETLYAQKEAEIRQTFTKPLEGYKDGRSYNSIIKDPAAIDAIVKQSLAPLDAFRTAIKNGSFSQAATLATSVTMSKNQAAKQLMDAVPQVQILAGLSAAGADQAVGVILQNSQLLPQLQSALVSSKVIETMGRTDPAKPPPGINAQAEEIKKANNGAINGPALKSLIESNRQIVMNGKLPAEVSAAGVRNLFDQDFFANLNQGERLKTWTYMGSPEMTSRVAELAKSDPTLMQKYESWSKYAFQATFAQDVSNARAGAEDPRFTMKFDPQSHQIVMEPKPGMFNKLGNGQTNIGEAYVARVNQGLRLLVPVFEAQKKDVNAGLLDTIAGMGIDLNKKTPDGNGGIIGSIGRTINQMFMGPPSDAPSGTAPVKPKGGRLSLNEAEEPALRQVIGQAESGGDYNSVFGMGKSTTRDLSQFTVGEITAMQKSYTDRGSPSSAVGKYQFLRKTLDSLVKEGVISADDQFTPDVQDQLAVALMKRRGLDDYRAGKITREQYTNNLAKEWAGLPTTNGMSFYAGDGLNASTVRLPQVLAALEK